MSNLIDVIIIIALGFGAVVGFKKGAIRTGVSFIGLVIAIILASVLRRPIASFMFEHLPFLNFFGAFKGTNVLNILLYEVLAFFIVLAILMIGVGMLNFVANIIEKALDFTIVLGIPSKIIGIIIGFVETYIYVFVVLYILALPMFNFSALHDAKLANNILNNTPILTKTVGSSLDAFQDVYDLKHKNLTNEQYNRESLDILLKYNITDVETIDKLIQNGKLKIEDVNNILNNYR